MQKVTNKQIAEAFKIAKKRIAGGQNDFICIALGDISTDAALAAEQVVSERLGNTFTYFDWVSIFHPEVYSKMQPDDFKQGRLQWLDSLIEEFSNKQD